jgi:cell filamentation protein, protein adenylyltransferase
VLGSWVMRQHWRQPVVMGNDVARMVGVSYTKANSLIAACEDLGILRQIGTGKRNRKFIYNDYVGILSEGTELSPGSAE